MSILSDAVTSELISIVRGYTVPPKDVSRVITPSVPMNIPSLLPKDLTEVSVRNIISRAYQSGDLSLSVADQVMYPADAVLRADSFLDKLDLVGTPNNSVYDRLSAIKSVLDLNRELRGYEKRNDFSDGLLGTMSDYWAEIPLFFGDLNTVFGVMNDLYSRNYKFGDFLNWCSSYHFRDGILDVTKTLLEMYGVPFEEGVHTSGFGSSIFGKKHVLVGVSAEEYMTTLCNANISVANSCEYARRVDSDKMKGGAKDWKDALMIVRDKTIKNATTDKNLQPVIV